MQDVSSKMTHATEEDIVRARIQEVLRSPWSDHLTSSGLPECIFYLRVPAGVFRISWVGRPICFYDEDALIRADESPAFEGSRIEEVLIGATIPILRFVLDKDRYISPGWTVDGGEEKYTVSAIPAEPFRSICEPYWPTRSGGQREHRIQS